MRAAGRELGQEEEGKEAGGSGGSGEAGRENPGWAGWREVGRLTPGASLGEVLEVPEPGSRWPIPPSPLLHRESEGSPAGKE